MRCWLKLENVRSHLNCINKRLKTIPIMQVNKIPDLAKKNGIEFWIV